MLWFGGAPHRQRRHADRRADRVPQLPDADPDVGDDGDVHVRDGPARRGLRRADRRGARHRVAASCRRPSPVTELRRPRARSSCASVDFRYPGAEEPVLRDVSLTARPGETTAIIGSTGAGKTTLLDLIPRLFDVTGGAVLVDGVDVRELDPAAARPHGRPGAAEAVPVHRHGRVQPALRQARTRPTTSCGRRCEIAQARDFVERDARAGSTRRSPRAARNVSGGQRQRLAIARALVRRPEIYLFDDSFSALDFATDAALRAALRPRDRRRDGDHRRPAGQHHPRRRPDRRARRRAGSSAPAPTPS